jgi:predicted transcriptional regulator of viral defense system
VKNKVRFEKSTEIFRLHGGVLKMSEALQAGIHRRMLYSMLEARVIERLSRGLYRLSDLPPLGNPDLVSVALRIQNSIITLISALAFHGITTQIPHEIYIALQRGAETPRTDYPPIRIFWFSGQAFTEGIETHNIDDVSVRIYSPEKTLADCFKYRNKIGLDTTLEALKLYRERGNFNIDALMQFARVCRVEKVMRPYVEALI